MDGSAKGSDFIPTILPWYGGKVRLASWIISLLPPHNWKQIYVEPFGGMAAVMRARTPVQTEVINDLDFWVVNWWRVVRDHKDLLGHLLEHSPHSRYEYNEHREYCKEKDDGILLADIETRVQAAHAWAVCIAQGHAPILDGGFGTSSEARRRAGKWWYEAIDLLSARFSGVLLEYMHALDIIERYSKDKEAVIYCDPPYTQGGDRYRVQFSVEERERLIQLFTECEAKVAISGYHGCFPELEQEGWSLHTKTVSTQLAAGRKLYDSHRVECVWVNYDVTHLQPTLWE